MDWIPLPVKPNPVAPDVYLVPVGPYIARLLTLGINVNPVPPLFTLTRYPDAPV
jgi:hypothetical protein